MPIYYVSPKTDDLFKRIYLRLEYVQGQSYLDGLKDYAKDSENFDDILNRILHFVDDDMKTHKWYMRQIELLEGK